VVILCLGMVFNVPMRIPRRAGLFVVLWLQVGQAMAQHSLEMRGSNAKYRYLDWSYTFSNAALIDVVYVGVPGSNEFNLGGGYGFNPVPSLTITPLVYAVIGKEEGQRGVAVAVMVSLDKSGWRLNAFLGHYLAISGDITNYLALDTFDFSKVLLGRWEVGLANGFLHADNQWNPQIGPLLKLNDRLGYWSVSYRFGPHPELQFSRVLTFKK